MPWLLLLSMLLPACQKPVETVAPPVAAASTQASMQKIVALNSDALEALRILQADPQVVGVYSDIAHETAFWPEMQGKPQVGKWNEPNIEAIAQLAPDLVIHYSSGSPHLEAKLQPLGIRVLRLDLFRIDTLEREITQLGAVLGKQEEAQRFTAWHRGIVDTVQQQAALAPAPVRAYLENYADYSVSGPGSALHQLCNLANCVNVAAHLKAAYPKVPPEWVVAENPAVIFKLTGKVDGYAQKDASDYNLIRDRIRARPAWAHIDAIQHQRVHVMDAALTSGPRVAVALAYLARWTHPEQVRVDPDALHRAYMEQFMRKPFQGHYSSGKLLP